jgi:hypothetical protein
MIASVTTRRYVAQLASGNRRINIDRPGAPVVRVIGVQGPPGAASAGIDFPFLTASTTWTINHNLGIRPAVQLRSLGHVVFAGDVQHPSVNQAVVTFVSPFAGYARVT